jgi:N-acetylgalactosamine-N,N'-diacetylbacillosaminyl-diphospho-undecaprenol 4-alpha-N-acetylgalactosaminyltransferase
MKSKIVLVTLSLEGGGAEKIVSRIIHNLYKQFDIVLVTFYPGGRYLDELLSLPGLEYQCINAGKGNTLSFALRLRQIVKKNSPDKVISFLYYPNIITSLSLIWLNIPMVLSERSNHRLYLTTSLKHRIWKFLLKRAYGKASAVISVSEESKKALISDFNLPGEKLYTIYNGISFSMLDRLKEEPVTEFEFKNEIRYIVAVGSLNRAKNYPLLIESFGILHSSHNNTSLIIIGKGALEGEIKERINSSGLNQVIHLTGYCPNPYKFMKHACCYVLSSSWEGFPNSLLEAMYINGHVVSTNCPTGPSEIIMHNSDGLLCNVDDPVDLAQAMERMCFDEDFRTLVYENSRKKIAKFDEQIMADKYRDIFQS